MTAIERSRTVAVVGAGTMGQGIAQVALLAGHRVLIYDINAALAADGVGFVEDRVDRMAAKGGWTAPRPRRRSAGSPRPETSRTSPRPPSSSRRWSRTSP